METPLCNQATVSFHIKQVIGVSLDSNSFERIYLTSILDSSEITAKNRNLRNAVIWLHSSCLRKVGILGPVLRNLEGNGPDFGMQFVERVLTKVQDKIIKFLCEVGCGIVEKNPSYLRSSRFNQFSFFRMCIVAEASDNSHQRIWSRMAEVLEQLERRVQIIELLYSCYATVDGDRRCNPDLRDEYRALEQGNLAVFDTISRYSEISRSLDRDSV